MTAADKNEEEIGTELVVISTLNPVQIFTPGGSVTLLEDIKQKARSVVPDISTVKGRKQIASLAYKVATTKTAFEKMRKKLNDDAQKTIDANNAEGKKILEELQALQDEVRKPLTDWEKKDEDRVAAHEQALSAIQQLIVFDVTNPTVEIIQKRIDDLEPMKARDFEEFASRADHAIKASSDALAAKLQERKKYDDDQAELNRLREEQAAREKKEREEKIAAEAAAKAKAEAEEKAAAVAKAAAERAEAERQKIQKEKDEAESRAKKAEEDRIAAAQKAKADAEAAESARIAAAAKAKADAEAAQARHDAAIAEAAAQAKRDAEAAAQKERDRQAAEKKAEEDAAAAREADKKHKAKINNEAREAIQKVIDNRPVGEDLVKEIIIAIAKGEIPHVKISY